MRDATLMLGFSLLWAGLFFAQYLTIWYGNIPEEVGFIYRRVSEPPLSYLSAFLFIGYFAIPFATLIPARTKITPAIVISLAALVGATFIIEKIVYLAPVSELSTLLVIAYWLLLGVPFAYQLARGVKLPPFVRAE